MNIFYIHPDPIESARQLADDHIRKMQIESAQMCCTAHWENGSEAPYKLSHRNHPCSIWARECVENYVWLCDLGIELCKEYSYRYGKKHKSQEIIEWCMINIPNIKQNGSLTKFALAMPDEYKVDSSVESYRNYYNGAKTSFAVWKNRDVPQWYEPINSHLIY